MKIFVNQAIRRFFSGILICIAAYAAAALLIVNGGFDTRYLFILSMLMAACILTLCAVYFIKQNKTIEKAVFQIADYLAGNKDARVECTSEGELYKLFHEINTLASVLNAHAENEQKAKEFLKDTISDISHQLKTPIAALNIYNGLIQDEAENMPDIKDLAQRSEQELDRMEMLVQNLLKITRLDAGAIIINKKPENLCEMLNCIYEQFSFRAEQEQKKILLSGEKDVDLLCDRSWLSEAVSNVVKNALDHTAAGGIINIEWKRFASVVQIIVKDNGSGIHPEDLHHIFKRFYRSRFSKDTQGIGLGLPLAKTIIEAHNGTIEADSVQGQGTVFVINFLITTKL